MIDNEITLRAPFLRALVLGAGKRALAAFVERAPGIVERKGHQDPVTEADRAVEAYIRQEIATAFPQDGFLGEETGATDTDQAVGLWVVDPIDGTDNFARGIAHFCVSIAWVLNGKVMLGTIFNPATDEFYEARRGRGATKNRQSIAVSTTASMMAGAVELGWSTRVAREHYLAALVGLLDQGANVRRSGSGALGLAWVAEGRLDGYAELHMNSWDCLAGLLLVQEAGGIISTPLVDAMALRNGGPVFASNRALAPGLIHALPHQRAA